MFDLLNVPIFGHQEDAADQFAGYIILHFGKADARRLILGAAHSYKKYVQNPTVTAPLTAFSDEHGPPAQRFYNLRHGSGRREWFDEREAGGHGLGAYTLCRGAGKRTPAKLEFALYLWRCPTKFTPIFTPAPPAKARARSPADCRSGPSLAISVQAAEWCRRSGASSCWRS
ncbi:MAG: hypothetical protein EHM67_00255 [Hyphomicrobiaceae bacterium]|nr:MAG: hypothetical protein EHM67_00255 [Hyphomicrobiaceae bacterium]